MIRIILNGVNGKMGQAVVRLAGQSIVCGVDINSSIKDDFPVVQDINGFSGKADVIIDFSNPLGLEKLLEYAVSKKIPVVIATTGLSKPQIASLEKVAQNIPVFFTANMSLGINLLLEVVKKVSSVLGAEYDIEIVEKHHNQKLDAPSGTALSIADAISDVKPIPMEYIHDRHSVRKRRESNEIGIHAVRGGTIVGEHTVIFAGQDEIIEIKHSALSRDVFATGAIRAAHFLYNKKSGLYSMKDLVSE